MLKQCPPAPRPGLVSISVNADTEQNPAPEIDFLLAASMRLFDLECLLQDAISRRTHGIEPAIELTINRLAHLAHAARVAFREGTRIADEIEA